MIEGVALFAMYNESSGSGKNTHLHEGYQAAFVYARKLRDRLKPEYAEELILDLFARECMWGTVRNDLNSDFLKRGFTNVCRDALELCGDYKNEEVDMILLDPPFSDRMAKDKYDEVGRASLYTDPRYMSQLGKECFRILSHGGVIVKAGFNSNSPAQGLTLRAIMLSRYGASRNDVIFTVWQKNQTTLDIN